jgi:hypothetical protein
MWSSSRTRSRRPVGPLPPFVVQALTEHAKAYEVGDDDLIFVVRTGAALKLGAFRARVWRPSRQSRPADGIRFLPQDDDDRS